MASNTFTFGENDGNIGKKTKAWKAEAGHTYRVSFAWWPVEDGKLNMAAPGPKFIASQINYIQNVGYVVNKGPEWTKIAGEPPKQKVATVLVVWPTDKKGSIDLEKIKSGDQEVVPWIFSGDKYQILSQVHKEFSFGEHDVSVTCQDAQFQKMTFSPCKDSLLKKVLASPERAAKILAEVSEVEAKIQDNLGRDLTVAQIREKLAGGGGGAPARDSDDSAVTTGNIDSIVDNLLD